MNLNKKLVLHALLLSAVLISCQKSSTTAITAQLDSADNYIQLGNAQEAVDVLDSIPRKDITPWNALGLYRRYALLGESEKAGKVVQKALRKNPRNLELNAVYVKHLLRENNFKKALSYGKILIDSEYAALYTEAQLRSLLFERARAVEKNKAAGVFLFDKKYVPLFKDAFNATGNSMWAQNAAVLLMQGGQYVEAAAIAPSHISSAAQALFWADIMYDSRNYESAILYLNAYKEFTDGAAFSEDDLLAASLMSDAMILSGKEEEADEERQRMIEALAAGFEFTRNTVEVPALYVNSAYWAKKRDMPVEQYRILNSLLENYPYYVPGLLAYGNYALDSAALKEDDPLLAELRAKGRRTVAMERFDAIPRVSVEDAVARIERLCGESGNKEADEAARLRIKEVSGESGYATLLAFKTFLLNKSDDTVSESPAQVLNRVWDLLEKSSIGTNLYPAEIVQYAINTLLHVEKYDEAEQIFYRYMQAKYGSADKRFVPEQNPSALERWECQYAAWFACNARRLKAALRLYEYLVYDSNVPYAPQDAGNLAMIYSSAGDRQKAVDLYVEAAGRLLNDEGDADIKSELLYRAARIHADAGRINEAIYVVDYALRINPGHIKGRLLQKELKK